MSDEKSPTVAMIEAHEEFVQHIEKGSSKIRWLSEITIVVASLLLVSYAYQLLLPYISGTTSVTVNLTDPVLQLTEVAVTALTIFWLYVGVRDLFFTRGMAQAIKDAREAETSLEKRITESPK